MSGEMSQDTCLSLCEVNINWRAGGHTVLTHTAGENEAEWYSRLRHYALGMQWGFFTLD